MSSWFGCYAFAMRLDSAIADGVEVAARWAKNTFGATGKIRVERLSLWLQPLGVQGVRPLRDTEIAFANREQKVRGYCLPGARRRQG